VDYEELVSPSAWRWERRADDPQVFGITAIGLTKPDKKRGLK
jgi:hypothetical protein